MAKYRVFGQNGEFQVEASEVAFNLDYNMIFFKDGAEVVASAPTSALFVKLKDDEPKDEDA